MITIQEIHKYYRLSSKGIVPAFVCPINYDDGEMIPWQGEDDIPCFWCISCNSKLYLGYDQITEIKNLLHL